MSGNWVWAAPWISGNQSASRGGSAHAAVWPAVVCAACLSKQAGVQAGVRGVQEIRRIWLGYLSQCDPKLGQKVAQKLQSAGAL